MESHIPVLKFHKVMRFQTQQGRLRPGVQFVAVVYDDRVKQCGATWEYVGTL